MTTHHPQPTLIVHGGAWRIPDDAVEVCQQSCRRALQAGWAVLSRGGSALDAVEAAVVVLEEDPIFDAGVGSHLNRDGRVELDAIVMEGATLRSGAVAAVERVRNPIRLARRVMESCPHMLLVGEGAQRFAVEQGMALCDPNELIVERERARWEAHHKGKACPYCAADKVAPASTSSGTGTVGAVACDAQGRIVAGTSTGGTCCKLPGRVGDSPLVGCGCYADAEAGGVSCTGWGEGIMRIVMAKTAADLLRAGKSAQDAADACLRILAERTQGTGGLILLDREGHPALAFSTPRMAWGVAAAGEFRTGV
ncbi:MAG TPA: isoaspartyl peptidase/L-asparaginase [Candidatus Acidoferrales bacterium]